jgi:polysaccharide biosynthesis protein PslG
MHKLRLKTARLAVAWDWYKDPYTLSTTDAWIAAVRAAHMNPLVAFNRHWRRHGKRAPSLKAYKKSFKLFRQRYPDVREFSAWNEPNAKEQPFYRKPALAARYFNAMRSACRRCTVIAGDVNDGKNMVSWVNAYRRKVRGAKIWALHNYKDTTAYRGTTRVFLNLVRGPVWLTETGGLKNRGGLKGQAKSVRRTFKLARTYRRVKRIYFYQWQHVPGHNWDSAFVTSKGKRRPAYFALRSELRRR